MSFISFDTIPKKIKNAQVSVSEPQNVIITSPSSRSFTMSTPAPKTNPQKVSLSTICQFHSWPPSQDINQIRGTTSPSHLPFFLHFHSAKLA
jgi:hypothetical protein